MEWWKRLWRPWGFFPYPLVVDEEVVAYHARRSGLGVAAITAALRSFPPERQRLMNLMTWIEIADQRAA